EGVAQDAEQPGLEVRAGRELAGPAQRPGVGLLHEVLGLGGVTGEVAREGVQGIHVGQGLASERIGLLAASPHVGRWYCAPRALSLSRLLTSRPAVRSIPRPMERPQASCVRTDGGT